MSNSIAETIINNSFANDRVSHSYIFVQDKNPHELADYFIEKLLGTKNIANHPCVVKIDGSNGTIKKDSVLNAISILSNTSTFGSKKILRIEYVENGNKFSLNSLLKFIEEPLDNTYIVMTSKNENLVIPTIVSRSQVVAQRSKSAFNVHTDLIKLGASPKHSRYLEKLNMDHDEAIEKYNNGFKKTIENVLDILGSALTNNNYLLGELNVLITKDNYKEILLVVTEFFNDVWRVSEGISLTFTERVNSVMAYNSMGYDVKKSLEKIFGFLETIKNNLNFTLAKTNLLLTLENSYA